MPIIVLFKVRRFEKILQTIELMPPWIYTCISATNIPMTDMNKDLMVVLLLLYADYHKILDVV